MKSFIVVAFLFSAGQCYAQNFVESQNKLKHIAKKKIRKEFIKSLTHDDWMSRVEAHSLLISLKTIPIISFTIGPNAIEYDSTKKIVSYLNPNEEFLIESAIFLKNKKFYATFDCFNTIYYSDCEPCNYDDSIEEKDYYHNYEEKKIFNAIKQRKYTLLFKVRYIRDAVWFIEEKEVKIYCPKDKLIYDPDEYIKKRCSVETIRNLALGKLHAFCD